MEGKQVAGAVFGTMFKVVAGVIIIMLVYRYSVAAYDLGYRIFGEEPVSEKPGTDISVTVTEAQSMKEIARMLENKGLIRDDGLFVLQEKLSSYEDGIRPGTYKLNTSMTAEEMIGIMSAVKSDEEAGSSVENPDTVIDETQTDGEPEETEAAEE